jgi:hypothetical protein
MKLNERRSDGTGGPALNAATLAGLYLISTERAESISPRVAAAVSAVR